VLRWLQRLEPLAYGAMRMVFGFLFVFHGLQKFGYFGGQMANFATLFGMAGFIETTCGSLILLGLFTVPAAFVASGEMAVAYFTQHQPRGGWPIQNLGELAVLYCFAFLFVATRGAGPLSLDGLRRGGKRR
jgi:putative oxidoreductase